MILRNPVISEKSTAVAESRKYIFAVNPKATKHEVKREIEKLFKVKVIKVNMIRIPGKIKTFRRVSGKRSDVKKAVVTLKKGDNIALFEGAKT